MSTTTKANITRYVRVALATLFVVLTMAPIGHAQTTAELNQKAAELQRQIEEGNKIAADLKAQADTLENKLAELNKQIADVSAQITDTTTKIDALTVKLDETTKELERQKSLLRASMRELYVSGDVSTIEMLANSNNFSEFIDEQKYLEQLKTGIQDSTKRVIVLKNEIESQKKQQEQLKEQQQAQQEQLTGAKNEQATLLDQTRGDEARYQDLVKDLRKQQADVNAQLAARLSVNSLTAGVPCGGGYPAIWCNAEQDSLVDMWGMYNRECVSYTAFRVWASGRNMPYWGGHGNANQWPGNARAVGIPVDNSPRVGDVAVSMAGYYGHTMYVEAVYDNGTILVSQYNFDYNGTYSTMVIRTGSLQFIHFP